MAEQDPHIPSRPAAPPSAQRLEAYLAGELPDEVRQEVEAQLGADELLRDAAEGLQLSGGPGAFAGAVGRLRAQARASVRERMHRRETLSRRRLRVMPDPRVMQIGLAVAASVALLFGSLWIFRYRQAPKEPLAYAQPAPQSEALPAPGASDGPGPAAPGERISGGLPSAPAMGPETRAASSEDLAAPQTSAPAPDFIRPASAPGSAATVQSAPVSPAPAQPVAETAQDDAVGVQPYTGRAEAEMDAELMEAEVSESRKRAEKALPAPMMTYEDSLRGAVLRAQGLADLFEQGMLRMQQGDSAAALDKFLEVLQGSPGHLPASYYAGLLHYRQGHYKAAQPLLETAASNPAASQYPAARLLLARNLIALGRTASARKLLEALAAAGGPEGREAAALLQQLR